MPRKKSHETFKALITADLHLSNGLPHAQPTHDGLTDRFEDQLRVLKQIKEVGVQEEVDAVFILGDVFDKRLLDAVTLRHSLEAFRNLEPLSVYVLPGNHDAHSQVGERFVSEVLRGEVTGWGHVDFLDAGAQLEFGVGTPWLTFWALPYGPLDTTRKRLAAIQKEVGPPEEPNVDILLMHHSVLNAVHLGWKCDAGLTAREVTEGFDYVFAGHFHQAQEFPGAEDRGCYIGGPMQLHYGEEGYPAELHVATFYRDSNSDIFSMEHFATKTPKFYTKAGIDEAMSCKKGDYLKIQIEATHAEWVREQAVLKARCKMLEDSGIHVKPVHKVLYHHEERLGEVKIEVGGMPELIGGYVDAAEVVTKGVGKKTLKKLGMAILEEARLAKGSGA